MECEQAQTFEYLRTEDMTQFSDYKPTRHRTYWLIHLEEPLAELKGEGIQQVAVVQHT